MVASAHTVDAEQSTRRRILAATFVVLAREGTRFLNAFATTPLCSPSRAALLTGQYVHTNGIIDNTARDAASHRLATFAVPLEQAGYETAFLGKWHMGNDDTRRPGWTHWAAMKGQGEAIDPQLKGLQWRFDEDITIEQAKASAAKAAPASKLRTLPKGDAK